MTQTLEESLDSPNTRLYVKSWRDHISSQELFGSLQQTSIIVMLWWQRLHIAGHVMRHH